MFEVNKKTLLRVFWGVCGCILLYWLLHDTDRVKFVFNKISSVLAPFVLGGVLAFILNVPVRALENKPLKKFKNNLVRRSMAVVCTFIALLLILALVIWLLVPQLVKTLNALFPALMQFLDDAETAVFDFLHKNPKLMELLNIDPNQESLNWRELIGGVIFGSDSTASGSATGGDVISFASGLLGSMIGFVSRVFTGAFDAVISLVFCIYCLFHKENLSRQGRKTLYAYCKEETADKIIHTLRLTNTTFSNFLSGQCIEVCILGGLFAVCMAIFRMPYIPLISVVIAVTAFIPIVGAWTGCILGAFLIFVQDPMLAVWFVVMFLVIQQIENNLIYPRIVGSSVGLSGMWVLLAVAIGGELMGIVGMFLMIPVASVVHTLLSEMINKKLESSTVDPEKLKAQPPEVKSQVDRKKVKVKKIVGCNDSQNKE